MLKTTEELVYIEMKQGQSQKTGNPYCFIKFANPKTFENYTISASDEGFSSDNLNSGDRVNVLFNLGEFSGRPNLTVKQIKKAG